MRCQRGASTALRRPRPAHSAVRGGVGRQVGLKKRRIRLCRFPFSFCEAVLWPYGVRVCAVGQLRSLSLPSSLLVPSEGAGGEMGSVIQIFKTVFASRRGVERAKERRGEEKRRFLGVLTEFNFSFLLGELGSLFSGGSHPSLHHSSITNAPTSTHPTPTTSHLPPPSLPLQLGLFLHGPRNQPPRLGRDVCMDGCMYGCMGCMGVWVYGEMGVWVYGHMGVWYGCMGVWVYGCWVLLCVCC